MNARRVNTVWNLTLNKSNTHTYIQTYIYRHYSNQLTGSSVQRGHQRHAQWCMKSHSIQASNASVTSDEQTLVQLLLSADWSTSLCINMSIYISSASCLFSGSVYNMHKLKCTIKCHQILKWLIAITTIIIITILTIKWSIINWKSSQLINQNTTQDNY